MKKEIDCRKMDCPAPVLETKKCLERDAPTRIRVMVDNDAAVENVSRFLTYSGFEVGVDSDGITSVVEGTRSEAQRLKGSPEPDTPESRPDDPDGTQKIVVLISSDTMGRGDDALGEKLMINLIKTLEEMGKDLWRLVFVNHGVKLAVDGSQVLDPLKALEAAGIAILVCGTCLTHLDLMERKAVGQTTNMLDIVTAMQLADKTISL